MHLPGFGVCVCVSMCVRVRERICAWEVCVYVERETDYIYMNRATYSYYFPTPAQIFVVKIIITPTRWTLTFSAVLTSSNSLFKVCPHFTV